MLHEHDLCSAARNRRKVEALSYQTPERGGCAGRGGGDQEEDGGTSCEKLDDTKGQPRSRTDERAIIFRSAAFTVVA